MISLIFSLLLAGQAAEPVVREASCQFNNSAPVPCAVAAHSENGITGVGFFSDAGSVTFVGRPRGDAVAVEVVTFNEDEPIAIEGACISQNGKVGCQVSADGTTLTVIATLK